MIVNYGYRDGSGTFIVAVDTVKCDGCGDCVTACPNKVLELAVDPYEPLDEKTVVVVNEANRKKVKYSCAPCKPAGRKTELPCVAACKKQAITHSW
jgi:NAD-dependent dihydropyrimidine dehydrogenase PreA subunit